jgi:hypothetical protein
MSMLRFLLKERPARPPQGPATPSFSILSTPAIVIDDLSTLKSDSSNCLSTTSHACVFDIDDKNL